MVPVFKIKTNSVCAIMHMRAHTHSHVHAGLVLSYTLFRVFFTVPFYEARRNCLGRKPSLLAV